MFTWRRVVAALAVVFTLTVAYSAWLAWSTERDLRRAEAAVDRLQTAIADGDDAARDVAVADLEDAAASAGGHTDGLWWSALTKLPVYGDDLQGVEALSASLAIIATDAVSPLLETADGLDTIGGGGRVDLDRLDTLSPQVSTAHEALSRAHAFVSAHDSGEFVGALKVRYDDYVTQVADLDSTFASAEKTLAVLPGMLGADGPRDYLFIFQNNAEIRSTGGIAGSWARIHAEDGRLDLVEQGSAAELNTGSSVAQLTDEELAVYDELPAMFFQDPNFIPDFQRAAELYSAFWAKRYPDIGLSGVVSLDPVGMSYLMDGTGPIEVDGITLTADTIVPELLSNTYLTISDPVRQDQRFQAVARGIFDMVTGDLRSPIKFAGGFARAVSERRFLIAPFDEDEARELDGTPVLGQLSGDEDNTPHVEIGVNDATGSKMSYYLRYRASIEPRSCDYGAQQLEGEVVLNQTISPREATALPAYVTGGGQYGIPVGQQLVTLRIYGPFDGSISNVKLNGQRVEPEYGLVIDRRPVVSVGVLIDSANDSRVTWSMHTGPDQTAGVVFRTTPGVIADGRERSIASIC